MPQVTIYVSQQDIEAARRIAKKMFPTVPDTVDAQHVLANAARTGLDKMRVTWNEPEDQANAYANAAIKRDQLARNDGRPDQDMTTGGMPLKPGS